MLRNNITLNKIFNFKYSNEFIERMLTKDLYCVTLSRYPYHLSNIEAFSNSEFNYEDPTHFVPDFSTGYSGRVSFEARTPLIVQTGESLKYVREFITNEKIPVAYYDINLDNYHKKSSLYDKKGQLYPYYIKAFRSNYTSFTLLYACPVHTEFSNFNDMCKLSNFSMEQAESILQAYQKSSPGHDRSVEGFRKQLKKCFSDANEYMNHKILMKQQKS